MYRAYVSSTRSDLSGIRTAVRATLGRLQYTAVGMEDYVGEGRPPIEKCLEDVRSCDVYIGLVAFRYGSIPQGRDKSFTDLELEEALARGIEPLIFMLTEDAPWPRKLMDPDPTRIDEFRARLGKSVMVEPFDSLADLRARLPVVIRRWEERQGVASPAGRTNWDEYRAAVVRAHELVQLSVIAGAKHDRIASVPLTEVFVPPLTETGRPSFDLPDEVLRAKREFLGLPAQPAADEPPGLTTGLPGATESCLDVLCRERAQVLLGSPGSGKSTLVHYALLELCLPEDAGRPPLRHLASRPLPFRIELRQYALRRAKDFLTYLVDYPQGNYGVSIDRDELADLLGQSGRAVVFFDGLDEIFGTAERAQVIAEFVAFGRSYPNVQIVVTSRIVGYDHRDIGVAGFTHYTLLNFNLPEIQSFVPRWYQHYTWEGDKRDAAGLLQRIEENPRLLELAGNPLLLTMMAVIYKHQDLPEQRWQLYERCTSVLLEDWDVTRKNIQSKEVKERVIVEIRQAHKTEILQRVALYMLAHGQPGKELNAISYRPLMKILAAYLEERYDKSPGEAEAIAEEILQYLRERSSILAEVGEGIFGFVHRTFMEYFAAGSCLAEFNAREADYDWLTAEVFGRHWHEDHWQEVLLLLAAMLADQGSPVRKVVDHLWEGCKSQPPHNVVFAARCLAEAGRIDDSRWATELMGALVEVVAKEAGRKSPREWPSGRDETELLVGQGLPAFSLLSQLVEVPPAALNLIEALHASTVRRARIAGWQMRYAMLTSGERLDFAVGALQDREEAVRRGAVAALTREWPRHPKMADALVEVVRRDRNTRVRQDALEALRRTWPGRSDLLAAIRARARTETAYSFTAWLIDYVAAGWAPSVEALDVLLDLAGTQTKPAKEYNYTEVVGVAALTVSAGWGGDGAAASALRQRASGDRDPVVRQAALLALALGLGSDDDETFELLRGTVAGDPDGGIRATAACALVRAAPDRPDGLPIIQSLAVDARADVTVRQIAVLGLGFGWPRDAGARATVRTSAREDSVWSIRRAAVEAVAGRKPTLEVTVDGFYGGRLLPGYDRLPAESASASPEDMRLLREVATTDSDPDVRSAALLSLRRVDLANDHRDVLRALALKDKQPLVRATALQLLLADPVDLEGGVLWFTAASLSDEDRRVFERAVRDRDPNVRGIADVALTGEGFSYLTPIDRWIVVRGDEEH